MHDLYFWADTFFHNVDFYGVVFAKNADFLSSTFINAANFSKAIFSQSVSFGGTSFSTETTAPDSSDLEYIMWPSRFSRNETIYENNLINPAANFSDAHFNRVRFYNVHFFHNADFHKSIFLKEADFENDSFLHDVDFSGTFFLKDACFGQSIFLHQASFARATLSNADFSQCSFLNDANFWSSTFILSTNFDQTNFSRGANFIHTIFTGDVHFSNTIFSEHVDFLGATFFHKVSFENIELKDSARIDFQDAILPDTIDFSYSLYIPHDIDLTVASLDSLFNRSTIAIYLSFPPHIINTDSLYSIRPSYLYGFFFPVKKNVNGAPYKSYYRDTIFRNTSVTMLNGIPTLKRSCIIQKKIPDKIHYINLYKSDVSKFHIDYAHFKLLFYDPQTMKSIPKDERIALYEQVLKNFKDRGQKDSYEILDKEYQGYKWGTCQWYTKWFGLIDRWWWDYGYEKWWVFLWTIGFLSLFTLITFSKLEKLQNGVYTIEIVSLNSKRRLWQSFLYTVSIFFPLSLKRKNIKSAGKGLVYIVVVYLAGLLCVAYIANFVIQK